MAIFRVHNNDQYTAMSNYHLRDTSLSLPAMGLLSFMLSCDEDFKFSIEGLTQCSSSGETMTRSALKELREKGYLRVSRLTNEKGKVVEWVYDVYEEPVVEKPHVENPHLEKPHVENQGQRIIPPTIISSSKDESINSCPPKVARFIKPTAEEVAKYCSERGNGIDAQAFIDFYESKDWMIGKNRMKDWRAAVRTWEKRHKEETKKSNNYGRRNQCTPADAAAAARLGIALANAELAAEHA